MTTREKIIQSAIYLFSQHGGKAVSLQKIADELSIQKSSIYYYFKTKAELMDAVIAYAFEHIVIPSPSRKEIQGLLQYMSPAEVLVKYGVYKNNYNEYLYLLRALYWLCFQEKQIPNHIFDLFQKFRGMLCKLLGDLVALGAIPDCNCDDLSRMWSSITFVFSLLFTHNHIGYNLYRNTVKLFVDIAVQGTRPMSTHSLHLAEFASTSTEAPQTTKQIIAHHAFQLFCSNGYEKTTMRQIAQRAGIQVGSIYKHYSSKKAILREVLDTANTNHLNRLMPFDGMIQEIRINKDPRLLVEALATNYLPTLGPTAKQAYRLIMLEQYRDTEIRDFFIEGLIQDCHTVANVLNTLVGENVIPPCPSYQIAQAYIFNHCAISVRSVMFNEDIAQSSRYRTSAAAILVSTIVDSSLQ